MSSARARPIIVFIRILMYDRVPSVENTGGRIVRQLARAAENAQPPHDRKSKTRSPRRLCYAECIFIMDRLRRGCNRREYDRHAPIVVIINGVRTTRVYSPTREPGCLTLKIRGRQRTGKRTRNDLGHRIEWTIAVGNCAERVEKKSNRSRNDEYRQGPKTAYVLITLTK